jgi:hypothetical protein
MEMTTRELKSVIKDLILEGNKQESETFYVFELFGPNSIGEKRAMTVRELKGKKYIKSPTARTFTKKEDATAQAKKSNDIRKQQRKEEAKQMGVKVSQLQKPWLWKVVQVVNGIYTGK